MFKRIRCFVPVFACLLAAGASAQTLRIGLAEDPDVLDPTLARSFVGRIVFASLCDKLFDIDEKLNIVPQLATGYEWSADEKRILIYTNSQKVWRYNTRGDYWVLDLASGKLSKLGGSGCARSRTNCSLIVSATLATLL